MQGGYIMQQQPQNVCLTRGMPLWDFMCATMAMTTTTSSAKHVVVIPPKLQTTSTSVSLCKQASMRLTVAITTNKIINAEQNVTADHALVT